MPAPTLKIDSLVLYKSQAGRITQIGPKKIELVLADGQALSVRPKDVLLLHPGPVESLNNLSPNEAELETVWELLAGQTTSLSEIAELAFSDFTPASAWAVWLWLADGLYFSGLPDAVLAHSATEVAAENASRAAKQAEKLAWDAFVDRLAHNTYDPSDRTNLLEVADLAFGRREGSRIMQTLGQADTPENAHALLLRIGYWDEFVNPYPVRASLPLDQPEIDLPPLLDEPRLDLTHLTSLAIDDVGSQDPDDAISLAEGRLWVHIADVAALISPDSPADHVARARGANLYLPEGTVHMLPLEATARLGLGLADISPALSFGLTLSAAGELSNLQIAPSWIRVTRLSYDEAEVRLSEEPLHTLYQIACQNVRRRQENKAIEIDLPEVRVRVSDGLVDVRPLPNLRSRVLVREAMLIAGEAIGRYALAEGLALPFASQDPPLEPLPPARTMSEMFARRRLMRPGQASAAPIAHAGLGLPIYVQATSPLRRYLDLVVHQQLRAYAAGTPLLDSQALMERVGAADAVSGSVRWAERRSNNHWTLVFLLQNPGWRAEGVVIDQAGRRHTLLIPDLDLVTDLYLRRNLALDSRIMLELQEVNLPTLEARFRWLP